MLTCILWFDIQQRKEILLLELAVIAPSSFSGVQLSSLCPIKATLRFHPIGEHCILMSGAGY